MNPKAAQRGGPRLSSFSLRTARLPEISPPEGVAIEPVCPVRWSSLPSRPFPEIKFILPHECHSHRNAPTSTSEAVPNDFQNVFPFPPPSALLKDWPSSVLERAVIFFLIIVFLSSSAKGAVLSPPLQIPPPRCPGHHWSGISGQLALVPCSETHVCLACIVFLFR